ncbi:MAG: hypothetical protein ABI333_12895 [bacterium]
MQKRRFVALLALFGALACLPAPYGCQAECDGLVGKEKPGIDPPSGRFFFPTGLALTPDGRYLFVTNGNSDLKYNGGSLVVVDLLRYGERLEAFRANPQDVLASSCRYAPQDPGVVECHEGSVEVTDGTAIGTTIPGLILEDKTIRTGYYPGFIALEELTTSGYSYWPTETADGVRRYRLYMPVRGDLSVTFVDVITDDASNVTCLDCGAGCDGDQPRDCEDGYRIEGPSEGREDHVTVTMPAEPYGLAVEPSGGFLVLAHLVGGSLSLVDLAGYQGELRRGGPDVVDVLEDVLGVDGEGRSGGYNVVQRDAADPCSWFYVSNRAAAQIASLRVAGCDVAPSLDGVGQPEDRGLRLVLGPSVVMTAPFGPLESGADMRGMVMSADGNRLYALSRTPPSLVVVDTTLEAGFPRNKVLDVVEVCPRPSVLRTRQGPLGRTLAYAVCYGSGEIYVVDTEDAQVVDRIVAGGGPHDLVIMPAEAPVQLQNLAFITNFAEHSVGVIDLDETSETYHQMIGRIGWPEELQQ